MKSFAVWLCFVCAACAADVREEAGAAAESLLIPTCQITGCDDGNPCTADACLGSLGCSHATRLDGARCEEPGGRGVCLRRECCIGVIVNGECVSCDDRNECTWDTGWDGCANYPQPIYTTCSRGFCDGTGVCVECLSAFDCEPPDSCTLTTCFLHECMEFPDKNCL
jgi:hypothetical protein